MITQTYLLMVLVFYSCPIAISYNVSGKYPKVVVYMITIILLLGNLSCSNQRGGHIGVFDSYITKFFLTVVLSPATCVLSRNQLSNISKQTVQPLPEKLMADCVRKLGSLVNLAGKRLLCPKKKNNQHNCSTIAPNLGADLILITPDRSLFDRRRNELYITHSVQQVSDGNTEFIRESGGEYQHILCGASNQIHHEMS